MPTTPRPAPLKIRYAPRELPVRTKGADGQWRIAKKVWCIYDTELGMFPYHRPELGKVKQDHPTEAAAQAEADRLNGV